MNAHLPADDPFLSQLERALDVMTRRQSLLGSNVSNIDTPGYKTADIDFKQALAQAVALAEDPLALRRTRSLHGAGGTEQTLAALVRPVKGLPLRNDGNNVVLDREMLAISETTGRYEQTALILRSKLRQLGFAASDGRSA